MITIFSLWVLIALAYYLVSRHLDFRALVREFLTPWQPEHDTWRRVHIWAHVVGGIGLDLGVRFAPVVNPAWQDSFVERLVLVTLFQAFWEWMQIENWRFADKPQPSSYPWWSAAWDLLLVLGAAVATEGIITIITRIV